MFAVWLGQPTKNGLQFEKPNIHQVISWFRYGGILSFEKLENCFVSYRGENTQGEILSVCERISPDEFEKAKIVPTISDFRDFAVFFPKSYEILLLS
ncbi:hypothetical protein D1R32_gp289 [Tunisvirus fontaine2]|uniref:Uncharacterized protein n=1 Tax=Tunisvirus fontaine2 TaxID=1421067 RepID=V9SFA7_9VIRU|nr:hypothetical protein D1R32_gp289 [Tunisvirus fontaine2]AHC55006.1 hypothetical protein TNS_ORF288 [Tunisvirus fontaine2]